jgi:hypothetical protein
MWCVNPHVTNNMLVCINSKLGHVYDWILLFSESIQSICVCICGTCWMKFLEHTFVIVVIEIDNIVLLVLGTTWTRIQQCIHDYSVYHEESVIVALIIASYHYIASSDYRIIPLLLRV